MVIHLTLEEQRYRSEGKNPTKQGIDKYEEDLRNVKRTISHLKSLLKDNSHAAKSGMISSIGRRNSSFMAPLFRKRGQGECRGGWSKKLSLGTQFVSVIV